jgi:hypothetical protein
MENDRKDPGFSSVCLFFSIGYPYTLPGVPNKIKKTLMKLHNSPSKLTFVAVYKDRHRVGGGFLQSSSGGRDTIDCGRGGGESQFRRGDIHCGTLSIYVLCEDRERVMNKIMSGLKDAGRARGLSILINPCREAEICVVQHGLVNPGFDPPLAPSHVSGYRIQGRIPRV